MTIERQVEGACIVSAHFSEASVHTSLPVGFPARICPKLRRLCDPRTPIAWLTSPRDPPSPCLTGSPIPSMSGTALHSRTRTLSSAYPSASSKSSVKLSFPQQWQTWAMVGKGRGRCPMMVIDVDNKVHNNESSRSSANGPAWTHPDDITFIHQTAYTHAHQPHTTHTHACMSHTF